MIYRAIIKFTGTTEIEFEEFYDTPPSEKELRERAMEAHDHLQDWQDGADREDDDDEYPYHWHTATSYDVAEVNAVGEWDDKNVLSFKLRELDDNETK